MRHQNPATSNLPTHVHLLFNDKDLFELHKIGIKQNVSQQQQEEKIPLRCELKLAQNSSAFSLKLS